MTRVETGARPARRLRRIQPMVSLARCETRVADMALARAHTRVPA
ncbi:MULTISPECIES: hypothetical protein [unclassified Nocardia]